MLYQQVAFLRDRLLALKMAILQDVADKDRFSLCLLNAHYLDSDGQLWLFIKNTGRHLEAFAHSRHIRINFFAPDKSFHVEGVGISAPLNTGEETVPTQADATDTFVIKVHVSHMEYYELKTRQAKTGILSLLYYKWLSLFDRHQAQRLLVMRKP
jgi:hypothetical protein